MAPNVNDPGGTKNDPDEIRDGVVSDATRFPGGFIDQPVTDAGAKLVTAGQFQVSNGTFFNSVDVSSQVSQLTDVSIKPDGTQLYVLDTAFDTVNQYSLSTSFDVSTASFSSSINVNPPLDGPSGLDFSPDGDQLYVAASTSSDVGEFSLSTSFDVSTASSTQSFDVSTQDTGPRGVFIRPDGSQLYVVGNSSDSVFEYALSTAFDVSTASFSQSFDVSTQVSTPGGLTFKPDGSQLYVGGEIADSVFQYSLATDFDISTATLTQSLDVSQQTGGPVGVVFKPDGSRMYIAGDFFNNVYQYAVEEIVGGA